MPITLKPLTDFTEIWYLGVFWGAFSDVNSDFTFENFKNFVVRKHMERWLQKILSAPWQTRSHGGTGQPREPKITFLMLHRLILKVTKFKLPPPTRLCTVVKNIFGAIMSTRVKVSGHS